MCFGIRTSETLFILVELYVRNCGFVDAFPYAVLVHGRFLLHSHKRHKTSNTSLTQYNSVGISLATISLETASQQTTKPREQHHHGGGDPGSRGKAWARTTSLDCSWRWSSRRSPNCAWMRQRCLTSSETGQKCPQKTSLPRSCVLLSPIWSSGATSCLLVRNLRKNNRAPVLLNCQVNYLLIRLYPGQTAQIVSWKWTFNKSKATHPRNRALMRSFTHGFLWCCICTMSCYHGIVPVGLFQKLLMTLKWQDGRTSQL